jgi:3-phosphoinositide dependent protein kinase-1
MSSTTAQPTSLQEFSLLSRLGDGSYSEVYQAHHDTTGADYALKVINKKHILRHKVVHQVQRERLLLSILNYEGIVKIFFTFQDAHSLYLALEYCPNGELYDQIRLQNKLSVATAQFYAAEIVLMLEYLRNEGVVHRDLKPENLLLTKDGHLKLTDFGSAKSLINDIRTEDTNQDTNASENVPEKEENNEEIPKRASSFVGTADYVCPEMLSSQPVSYSADLWALGCVLYQMLAGKPPFKAETEYLTYQKITAGEYMHLETCHEGDDSGGEENDLKINTVSKEAKHLVEQLLIVDPKQRVGAENLEDLKNHSFFKGIQWETLRQSTAPEVSVKSCRGDGDSDGRGSQDGYDWELQSMKAQKSGFRY